MARARRESRYSVDIWPGFVDALSTLLLGFIFLLVVFLLGQFFLNQLLQGKDTRLHSLEQSIAQLTSELDLEQATNAELRQSVRRDDAAQRPHFPNTSFGHAQVDVGARRPLDERRELGVVEARPPEMEIRGGAAPRLRARLVECRWHRKLGREIVRPDRTAAQDEEKGRRKRSKHRQLRALQSMRRAARPPCVGGNKS